MINKESQWPCGFCTFMNFSEMLMCEMCEQPRVKEMEFKEDSEVIDLLTPRKSSFSSSSTSNESVTLLDSSFAAFVPLDIPDSTERPYSLPGMLKQLSSHCRAECVYLSHPFPEHYTQRGGYGSNWSCGYRNIQTLHSALHSIVECKSRLFAKPPTIQDIQQSLEQAWLEGFDPQGAMQLEHKLQGTNKWIGATECAVFFRARGFRAEIVDFVAEADPLHPLEHTTIPNFHTNHISTSLTHPPKRKKSKPNPSSLPPVVRRLYQWIYKYFASADTFRPPLYLQYYGHSVSIVGVIKKIQEEEGCLVTFDPIDSTQQILCTLYETLHRLPTSADSSHRSSTSSGSSSSDTNTHSLLELCPQLIKPISRLKNRDYQIVYIEAGEVMTERERDRSKTITSSEA